MNGSLFLDETTSNYGGFVDSWQQSLQTPPGKSWLETMDLIEESLFPSLSLSMSLSLSLSLYLSLSLSPVCAYVVANEAFRGGMGWRGAKIVVKKLVVHFRAGLQE